MSNIEKLQKLNLMGNQAWDLYNETKNNEFMDLYLECIKKRQNLLELEVPRVKKQLEKLLETKQV